MSEVKILSGIHRGVVKRVNDPLHQNRVQVELQTAPGQITEWVWPVEPSGITTDAPVVGQGVWVSFQGGNHDFPVWHGDFGKNKGNSKYIHIKPLSNSVSLSGISDQIILRSKSDGTKEVDLTATIIAMAQKIKNHEDRIASLESQITQKASISHSHPGL